MNTAVAPIEELFRRMNFLVVDPSAGRADTIERYLLLTGAHMVRRAASPLLALRILQDKRLHTDCVLCQLDMQPMSGFDFLANLRGGRYGGHPLCDTKFILLSRQPIGQASDFKHLRLDGLIAGAFDRDQLCEAVFKAVSPAPGAAAGAGGTAPSGAIVVQPVNGAAGPGLPVAHIREQGVDLVIVLVEADFAQVPPDQVGDAVAALRRAAAEARLGGEVVPVWDMGDGRMGFIAPPGYHPYFQSISLDFVRANVNREIAFNGAGTGQRRRSA
ncbi:MAG: response regulator [Rhodospirillaceae bacterium]|nr:response regulator [Rhodospirillaceae bacterium]